MKCPKCKKPIKENTEGNSKYCQGHSPFTKEDLQDGKVDRKSKFKKA